MSKLVIEAGVNPAKWSIIKLVSKVSNFQGKKRWDSTIMGTKIDQTKLGSEFLKQKPNLFRSIQGGPSYIKQ